MFSGDCFVSQSQQKRNKMATFLNLQKTNKQKTSVVVFVWWFFLQSATDWSGWSPTGWVCNILNLWVATFDRKAVPGDRQPVSKHLLSDSDWPHSLSLRIICCLIANTDEGNSPATRVFATSIQVIFVYKSKVSLCHFAVKWLQFPVALLKKVILKQMAKHDLQCCCWSQLVLSLTVFIQTISTPNVLSHPDHAIM